MRLSPIWWIGLFTSNFALANSIQSEINSNVSISSQSETEYLEPNNRDSLLKSTFNDACELNWTTPTNSSIIKVGFNDIFISSACSSPTNVTVTLMHVTAMVYYNITPNYNNTIRIPANFEVGNATLKVAFTSPYTMSDPILDVFIQSPIIYLLPSTDKIYDMGSQIPVLLRTGDGSETTAEVTLSCGSTIQTQLVTTEIITLFTLPINLYNTCSLTMSNTDSSYFIPEPTITINVNEFVSPFGGQLTLIPSNEETNVANQFYISGIFVALTQ